MRIALGDDGSHRTGALDDDATSARDFLTVFSAFVVSQTDAILLR